MVTAISLARRRGEDQSPGSHTDFVSHSTGRLVWGISSPSGSRALSLGARALFSWSRAVPSTFISIFSLNSFTSYRLLSEDWGLFQISAPSVSFVEESGLFNLIYSSPSDHEANGDLVCLNPFVRSHSRLGFSMFEPLVRSHSRLGFSHYLSPR